MALFALSQGVLLQSVQSVLPSECFRILSISLIYVMLTQALRHVCHKIFYSPYFDGEQGASSATQLVIDSTG